MKVNDVFNFAFDKSIKRGNYDPATMMHEDAELMYMLDEYASNNDFSEEKEKDSLTIESKTGNVIKLNFKSKTKGSA